MTDSHRLDRKNFLKLTISVAGAGASAWLVGCSDAEDPEATGGAAGTTGGTPATGGRGGTGGGGTGGTGTSGAGTGGTTAAGTGGKAGSAGSAGSGVGGGGTGAGGGAGTSPGGSGGAGGSAGGAGGTGGGAGGTGGTSGGAGGALGGAGSGGKGGGKGGSGGTGGTGGSCAPVTWSQNATCTPACSPHTHVPTGAALTQFLDELAAHITGPDALMPLRVPMDGAQSPSGIHGHFITFTQPEITTLLGGGSINNKVKDEDEIDDNHTWTISCG